MLKEKERLDDLECKGYKLIQSPEGYCFTSDSVLLANLARVKKTDRVVDLCTGSGVVALLIDAKFSPKQIIGIEIQQRLADMASRSVALNKAESRIKIINVSVQDCVSMIGNDFDVVTVNPPYETLKEKRPDYSEKEIAKSEVMLTLDECISTASNLLKYGGSFYMINKARRLSDTIFLMKKYRIEPKKIYFIQPKADKDVDTFVIEGKKDGKPSLNIPAPIIVYNDDGEYTDVARRIYGK